MFLDLFWEEPDMSAKLIDETGYLACGLTAACADNYLKELHLAMCISSTVFG